MGAVRTQHVRDASRTTSQRRGDREALSRFVGPYPARGVRHSEGRQRRRITTCLAASSRRIDDALAGRMSDPQSSFCLPAAPRVAHGAPTRPRQFRPVQHHARDDVRVVSVLLPSGGAPASPCDQRRSGSAAPAVTRAVTPLPTPAASPSHPVPCPEGRPDDGGFLWICEGTTHHGSQEDNMATTATTPRTSPSPTRYWSSSRWTRPRTSTCRTNSQSATKPKAGSRASTRRFTA